MEITDGGGGALGGTASSMCAISPSDLVGTIGNLISRIENLELALSQVLGANLHANTLGDISSQVGWVYGVEYMGVPGWIQTEYGTLIPPPGFTLLGSGITLSDGNTYSAVSYDSNGVLQFGFTEGGLPAGPLVDQWSSGTLPDYAIYKTGGSMSLPTTFTRGITMNINATTNATTATFTLPQAGLYQVIAKGAWVADAAGGSPGAIVTQATITAYPYFGSPADYGTHRSEAIVDLYSIPAGLDVDGGFASKGGPPMVEVFDLPAGAYISANLAAVYINVSPGAHIGTVHFSCVRLGQGSQ